MNVTRFAPSPNGSLHLGHAFSAIVAHDLALSGGRPGEGRFLLRIEDIDGPRSRPELPEEFRADLAWLGLEWREVAPQSTRLASYESAANTLRQRKLLYRCGCTRSDIARASKELGLEHGRYPGTCRKHGWNGPGPAAWRLDVQAACEAAGELIWEDALLGPQFVDPANLGDIVLVRKDAPASYNLAVTLDDAADGVTLVARGRDLLDATPYQRLLQELLGLPVPRWHHHALLTDRTGDKLAKRRGSPSLADRRKAGEDGRALANRLRAGNFPAGISLG